MVLPFPDEVPHPWRRHQHLARHDTPLAVVGGDERLGDDALQGVCELRADLVLLVRREDVYDPVDGLRGILGVQRAEDEMPSLRRSHSERDGLEVTHLAYEYHVGVLPQDMLESLGEALGVLVDLALVDDALLVLVQELYGILHAHDALVPGAVDLVDHGGEGGRFPAACRACNQDEPARLLGEFFDSTWQPEFTYALYLAWDGTESRANSASLKVDVDPEAGAAWQRVGKVELPLVLQALALVVGEEVVDQVARRVGRQGRIIQRLDLAADPHHGRQSGRDVQVARPHIRGVE